MDNLSNEKIMAKAYKGMLHDNKERHKNKLLLFLWLIPVIIVAYLLYSHFIADRSYDEFYDLGSTSYSYLAPTNRTIADPNERYLNITENLVYFDIPIEQGSQSVDIVVDFQNNFPPGSSFLIGAKNRSDMWSYQWKTVHSVGKNESISGDWQTVAVSFDLENLTIKDGNLNIALNMPHLVKEQTKNYSIPIDWISVTVQNKGIFSR